MDYFGTDTSYAEEGNRAAGGTNLLPGRNDNDGKMKLFKNPI
jgi:hypothetical protein